MSRKFAIPAGLCGLAAACIAHAHYSIEWYVIAGGGGPAAGPSVFSVEGTIGQPLANASCSPGGDCVSAGWALNSGYWTRVPCDTTPDAVFCDAFEG